MSEFIFRLFVKDSDNTSDAIVRQRYGVVGGGVGIFVNVILFAIKLLAGLFTYSLSVIADAFNNLSDALSSVITLVGFKLAGKKADHEHPFGHGRIEYVSALFVSVVIILMGFELLKSSVDKIINPGKLEYNIFSIVILGVSILLKLWLYFFNTKLGNKIDSQSVIASAKDSLSDCVATLSVVASLVVFKLSNVNIDGYVGLVVSLFIMYTGYQTIKESLSPLLGIAPTKEMVDEIRTIVCSHPEVVGMHDLVIHNYGPTRFMISLHAEVRADRNVLFLHEEIDNLERKLNEALGCEAVIHMDPVETENEIVIKCKSDIVKIISDIDENLSIHDFRMVSGVGHTNLIFDVVVPYEFRISTHDLDKMIKDAISEYNSSYRAVIEYDNLYV